MKVSLLLVKLLLVSLNTQYAFIDTTMFNWL